MTQEELRRIGTVQLQIMDEVHRLCELHHIRYYMIAGTLLGAVRHSGFIPWDLDIDVAMPRADYERFREICKTKLDEAYCYLDHTSGRNYPRPHALVTAKDTKICMKYDPLNPKPMELGIYVDIFPLDHAPDDEKLRRKQAKKLRRIRRLKQWRLPYSYSYRRWKRYAHYTVSALLSWISVPRLNAYQQKQMQKYDQLETKCLCSMASGYPYEKQCMPKEIYGEPVLLEFEGRKYYAPEHYEEWLTRLYGDYMQLPPPEKRQANLEIYASVEF